MPLQPLLGDVRKLVDYRESCKHIFPSDHSLQWFVRQNRRPLIESGALIMLTGQWYAVAEKFDAFVVDAGRRLALKHREGADKSHV